MQIDKSKFHFTLYYLNLYYVENMRKYCMIFWDIFMELNQIDATKTITAMEFV